MAIFSPSRSARCCSSSSPGAVSDTTQSGTRNSSRYLDQQRRLRQVQVSRLDVRERKSQLVSLARKETHHVYHHNNAAATCGLLTDQASHQWSPVDCLLCHRLCGGMDCHPAPGAGPEWPGPVPLHYPRDRTCTAGLLVLCPGFDRRAYSGFHCRDRHHFWKRRDAAVVTALCAMAGGGGRRAPRDVCRAPAPPFLC